jgi:hypothetical protein
MAIRITGVLNTWPTTNAWQNPATAALKRSQAVLRPGRTDVPANRSVLGNAANRFTWNEGSC